MILILIRGCNTNGNLISDGANTYTWDRANRMTDVGSTTYTYDGLGNRVQQDALQYILDMQPSLTNVIADSAGSRFVHSPRGIYAQSDGISWDYTLQDGLGSVRSHIASQTNTISDVQSYDPYGAPDAVYGAGFGFTGEQTDANGQVYLRARYYDPGLGIFPSLDPYEGTIGRPMSLNGYSWVEGNVVNGTDASGLAPCMEDDICKKLLESPGFSRSVLRAMGCLPALTPSPSSTPCDMRDQNGVNALAATAITETDGGGLLSQDDEAVAALMLMQVNSFRNSGWRQLGTFEGLGETPSTIIANQSQTRILDIATIMVDGYCQNGDALSQFTSQNYPDIANSEALATIAGNIDARFEISIDATKAEQFSSDARYPLQFVITAEGAERAIVVGGVEITAAWIEYQCPVGENAVVGTSQNPDALGTLQVGVNVTCQPCIRSTRQWWYPGNGYWELLPNETFLDEWESTGVGGYVASCSTNTG